MPIRSIDIDVSELLNKYGMQSVLESMIEYLDFKSGYLVTLRKDLQTALDNYTERYDKDDNLYSAQFKK